MIYILLLAGGIILVLGVAALCLYLVVLNLKDKLAVAVEVAQDAQSKAILAAGVMMKEREKELRTDAVKRSTAVVTGKVAEHMVPFREDFGFNPRDVRFLGSPIDFICFDGLTEGTLDRIVFVEVKAGRFKSLSGRERQVRDIIDEGSVGWELLHVGGDK